MDLDDAGSAAVTDLGRGAGRSGGRVWVTDTGRVVPYRGLG